MLAGTDTIVIVAVAFCFVCLRRDAHTQTIGGTRTNTYKSL